MTDNGIQFTNQERHKHVFQHIFDRVYEENEIEHSFTKIGHPWTNGQVERMNRTLKDATVKKYYTNLISNSKRIFIASLWSKIKLKDSKLLSVSHLMSSYLISG